MKTEIAKLAEYRMSRAEETFNDGCLMLEEGSCNSAVNRFYYAAFYAARALLATKGMDSSKHSGVISIFQREFVKAGIFDDIEIAKILSRSFEKRQDSDYEDFVSVSEKETEELKNETRRFIDKCKDVLKKGR